MKPPRARKVKLVNCRVTVGEMTELRRLANAAGTSVSEYIRAQLFRTTVETRVDALEAAIGRIMDRVVDRVVDRPVTGVRAGGAF